jgi:hypothetical protein
VEDQVVLLADGLLFGDVDGCLDQGVVAHQVALPAESPLLVEHLLFLYLLLQLLDSLLQIHEFPVLLLQHLVHLLRLLHHLLLLRLQLLRLCYEHVRLLLLHLEPHCLLV